MGNWVQGITGPAQVLPAGTGLNKRCKNRMLKQRRVWDWERRSSLITTEALTGSKSRPALLIRGRKDPAARQTRILNWEEARSISLRAVMGGFRSLYTSSWECAWRWVCGRATKKEEWRARDAAVNEDRSDLRRASRRWGRRRWEPPSPGAPFFPLAFLVW
jgi:hypothetical protein